MRTARLFALAGLAVTLAALAQPARETLSIDGEVYAQKSAVLLPPTVENLWMLNITRIAPDGGRVKRGEVVLAFDGNQLQQQLAEKTGKLAEKQRALESLQLDLAERERDGKLATAEAQAKLDKAKRKTTQPETLIAAVEYRKLVIDRDLAQCRLALAQRREVLATEQRRQERRLLQSEITQLSNDLQLLQTSLAALEVKAPRGGLMQHKSNWRGEKFDTGSQVFRGQGVAEIPDPATLAVRASLPERELGRVRLGMPVRVVSEGAGTAVDGAISSIGQAVRSKSRVQPIPILDVEVRLREGSVQLKPGQSVRVELRVPQAPRKLKQ